MIPIQNQTPRHPNPKLWTVLFWGLTLVAAGLIGWKFFASQEQPMESKILTVFITCLICAVLFRWIRKKANHPAIDRWTQEAIEWSDTGISAVLLAFFIMAFLVQAFKIPSGSMQPTLQIGDHLFVNKFIYGIQIPFTLKKAWNFKDAKRFEVVIFLCPPEALSEEEKENGIKKDFIKRAIGLPGDTIEIKDKVLFINGEKVQDSHAHFFHPFIYRRPKLWNTPEDYQKSWEKGQFVNLPVDAVRDNFGPIRVPENHLFVMGDNRDGSFDSRFWGPLPMKFLKGRALLVYWPLNRLGSIH